jgi:hypothetical protein
MAQRKCRAAHDGKTPGEVYRDEERVDVYLEGWPAVCRACAWHLDWFFRLGPATPREHAARSGRSLNTCRLRLAQYAKAGHLAVTGRDAHEKVYDLAPAVRARRAGVLAFRSREIPA